MGSTTQPAGSAERWGPLWGDRPGDWAENEELQVPTYVEAIRRVGIDPGQRVLDIGCGSGVFLRLAADRGAEVFGLDASKALIEVARTRVPEAKLRVGEMQTLPYAEGGFDLVTGFNSFFFATDMVASLREAGRVARQGAPVVIQVWGVHENCDLEAMKEVVRPFMPPRPAGAPQEPELWRPEVLEEMAAEAGLIPESGFTLTYAFRYPDEKTLARLMLASAGIARLVGPSRQAEVTARVVEGLAPFRTPEGGYRLENEFRFLVARA